VTFTEAAEAFDRYAGEAQAMAEEPGRPPMSVAECRRKADAFRGHARLCRQLAANPDRPVAFSLFVQMREALRTLRGVEAEALAALFGRGPEDAG
jgi:hypothetical protein